MKLNPQIYFKNLYSTIYIYYVNNEKILFYSVLEYIKVRSIEI
jgi:hypothetical protein